jgi:hypothetical protein
MLSNQGSNQDQNQGLILKADIRSVPDQGIDNQVISGADINTYTCEVCGKTFGSPGALQAHKLRSHRISPLKKEGRQSYKPTLEETGIPDPL